VVSIGSMKIWGECLRCLQASVGQLVSERRDREREDLFMQLGVSYGPPATSVS
jgi:hypothetical protein